MAEVRLDQSQFHDSLTNSPSVKKVTLTFEHQVTDKRGCLKTHILTRQTNPNQHTHTCVMAIV